MKLILKAMLAAVFAISGRSQTRSDKTQSDKARLNGKPHSIPQPIGMMVYTRDGHMSVQLMYPKQPKAGPNEYAQDGHEASFGSYDLNEATHTFTHHVQGSITRDLLVGRDLPRKYEFSVDGHLIIRSARPDERCFVTWEQY